MTAPHQHGTAHDHAPVDPNAHLSPTEYWEKRYGDTERVWSGRVNATMAAVVGELTPGAVIDLGCGEGGDVLWLAEQGWQAHGLDISSTAVGRAREEAAARGLEGATFTATDLTAWQPEPESVDLVTASFFQSNVALDRAGILRAAASAVRPGGRLVVIAHAQGPAESSHRGPNMLTARENAAELALPSDRWTVETAEERPRPTTGHDGQSTELVDAVLVMLRR
ncbi:bifunctional 2-polyprenyl-6-hydroxyphenol methylase/3-demethylubiquinol 3-O-methyltransferase UbiG [Brachybacterium sp. FME24]|uniref:class I SAM-dependent methyltransferase n=1 Tax=Brachybacterium sp. FME24 TaxID=2742605 RepID=UPI0018686989|nr:class I SAM-dependent methyltransferase [Brachybacterium sp. FME24]